MRDESDASSVVPDELQDIVRRMIGEIWQSPDRSLAVECLAAISGLSYMGDSLDGVACRHGVSREDVIARCAELSRKLGVVPSRATPWLDLSEVAGRSL